MEHEVVALEALRDSSVELLGFLEGISSKLDLLNEQAEMASKVLENWTTVFNITRQSLKTHNATQPTEIIHFIEKRLL
uniref:AlNc14C297G10327 protein n=1 Tax=Albugo laibachii Nc14 TaxID=890382 RepID=F0WVJ2_9STRA|nr:AlNc14C297G10327 [Albugo laibachii Nc14]|eukprot:CCA25434.1 AlNc14C297G10327 [Albugo laibachii Nc14]